MVFNLYKKRDFGAYMSDSIEFFKKFWKNYFLNYISLNGVLLLILVLIYYFLFKDTFEQILSNPNAEPTLFLDENIAVILTLMFLGFIVAVIFTLITTAYPIAYFRLVEKTDKETFTASEILNEIKGDVMRIVVFGLLSIFTFLPILGVFFMLSSVLVILLVGIPLLIIGMGAATTWINQSLYVYLNEKVGFIDAMKAGWKILFSKIWHIAGASTAMIFITSTLAGGVSMVFYFIGLAQMMATANSGDPNFEDAMPWMVAYYVTYTVLSYTLSNFIYINQGLIYYSNKEETENYAAISEIDTIGMNEN